MDTVTLKRIETAHPAIREQLANIYKDICALLTGRAICRFTHVFRSFEEQDALYNKHPRVTNARAGQSYHNYGLAVDIVLIVDGKTAVWDTKTDFDGDKNADWMEVVEVFKKYGWEWGGDWKSFKDYPHFEKTFGKSTKQLLNLYQSGRRDANGYVLL